MWGSITLCYEKVIASPNMTTWPLPWHTGCQWHVCTCQCFIIAQGYVNSLGGCITGLGYFLLCKDRVDKSRSNYVAIMKYMSRGSQWLWLYCCEPFLRSIQDCYTELYTDCTMLSQPLDSPLCTRSHPTPPCPSVEWDYSAVNTIRKRRETQIEAQSIQIIIHVKLKFCFVLELK